ncbi:GDP-mannose 4,6-dehydratase [Paenibacillus sp. RC67]|uniref:GDP-mannose 4,6-dehydratase n=1 Tax=Paenibacillus sp. RC67 TaxID=3039392 RepID=UPI0024AD89EE|nr:GDP-mannose 4,6-dehydratase [Paenibacillus sp. RC67]
MKALITGITGFVAKYLADYLRKQGCEVWGTTRKSSPVLFNKTINIVTLDLNSSSQILQLVNDIQPDCIFHLAGQSSVRDSWDNKAMTFDSNIIMTINLLEAVRSSNVSRTVKILTIGSSEEYGEVKLEEMPIVEGNFLRPISPYGISKATVSMLVQHYYKAYSLNIIHARPFNHIGPGQGVGFVTSDFAKQISEIERGELRPILKVGNLDAKRDFTDVRDIVRAYYLLTQSDKFGEIYNVCSGKPISIQDILDKLIKMSLNTEIQIQIDVNKMRPSDFPYYYGDSSALKSLTNWSPVISIDESLQDIMNYWRSKQNSN